jgi:hypothetical protein
LAVGGVEEVAEVEADGLQELDAVFEQGAFGQSDREHDDG